MATNWPNSVQTFTNPTSGSALNSPSHADQHATVNDTVEALQTYAGLVLVKSVTIGSGVSSVTVTNAFDSRFDNYRLLVHIKPTSAISGIKIQFGTTTTNSYFGSYAYSLYTATSVTVSPANAQNFLYITDGDNSAFAESHAEMTVYSPNIARRTTMTGMHYGRGFSGWQAGQVATTDQYTSFVLFPSTGTFANGGTIKVYGYNNG